MPTRPSGPISLLDTSAAIAFLVSDHEAHDDTFAALADRRLGLAGHAAFETYSVLTRLPPPARLTPQSAARLISSNFPYNRFLSSERAAALLTDLPGHAVAGGAVYDALVGAAAREHGLPLVSLDRRAMNTYRALDVDVELLA